MKYTIYIKGYGAEVTQGILPEETVAEIYNTLKETDQELPDYLVESQFSDDRLDWYEVDSNFHTTGAYLDDSTIYVEDESGNVVWQEECCNLECEYNHTDEIEPMDTVSGWVGVLTCLDIQKGTFTQGTLDVEEFNSELISIKVNSLMDIDLITSIQYNEEDIADLDFGDTISKDFKAYLED